MINQKEKLYKQFQFIEIVMGIVWCIFFFGVLIFSSIIYLGLVLL